MATIHKLLGCALLCTALHALPISPPPPASAGVVEREIEREFEEARPVSPDREVPLLEIDVPKEQLNLPDDVRVQIDCVDFSGNTAIQDCELDDVLTPYLGQEQCMADIKKLCNLIQDFYAEKGYFLARAFPPPQKIESGCLRIQIIEGCLGNVEVRNNCHYSSDFITCFFENQIGRPINYNDFLKALYLLNENWDLSAGAVFTKGEEMGTADVVLEIVDTHPFHLYANSNSYGTGLTTKYRTGLRADYGNLLIDGDRLSFIPVVGSPINDLYFFDGIYELPLSFRGTYLSLSFLYSAFDVNRLSRLDLGGDSLIGTIEVRHALQRTNTLSTDGRLSFDIKQLRNFSLGSIASYDRLRILSGGFHLDGIDPALGRNIFDLSAHWGIPSFLGSSSAVSNKASRKGAGGRFLKFNLDYLRLQGLPWDWMLLCHLTGQYSFYKLVLGEQFYIGGIDTVRGYPLAISLGDQGYTANLELQFPLPYLADRPIWRWKRTWGETLRFIAFVDHGATFLKGGSTSNQRNDVFLTSAGTGFRVYGPWNFDFSFDVGWGLTKEFRPSSAITYLKFTWNPF